LNFNYGNDGAISVSGTGMLISYGSSNSDSAKIGWGYAGTQRGFLSASGFVFAQRNDAGVSYGFSASNGSAVPNVGIGTSATGMVFYGDVNSSGAFANTSTATFNHLVVTGTISIPGTLNIAGLTTGSLQATSIYVPFSTTTTTTIMNTLEFTEAVGVASSTLSVGTLSAVNAEVTGNLYGPTINDLRDKWRSPSQDLILNMHVKCNGVYSYAVDWFADPMVAQKASPYSYIQILSTASTLFPGMTARKFGPSGTMYDYGLVWEISNIDTAGGSLINPATFTACNEHTQYGDKIEFYVNRNLRRVNFKFYDEAGAFPPSDITNLLLFRFDEIESGSRFDHVFEVMFDINNVPATRWEVQGIKIALVKGDPLVNTATAVTFSFGDDYMVSNFVGGKGLFAIRVICDGAGNYSGSICDITKRARTFPTW
jgi:hypothetical protein